MSKQLRVTPRQWNIEHRSGKWTYLDSDPVERARHAVIGMLCRARFPAGSVLDVGCGEGTLSDFLDAKQKKKYVGIDVSEEAVKIAQRKRDAAVVVADAESFQTSKKFDVIVLNEVLYYLDVRSTLKRYSGFLGGKGILIISVYRTRSKRYDRRILSQARLLFKPLGAIEISGKTKGLKVTWHVEVFAKRR